jgi:hypothetical protein
MLRAKNMSELLRRADSDESMLIMLVTEEGSLVASSRSEPEDQTTAAVIACTYLEYMDAERYLPQYGSIESMFLTCPKMRVAVATVLRHGEQQDQSLLLMVAAHPDDAQPGQMWRQLARVRKALKMIELEKVYPHAKFVTADLPDGVLDGEDEPKP